VSVIAATLAMGSGTIAVADPIPFPAWSPVYEPQDQGVPPGHTGAPSALATALARDEIVFHRGSIRGALPQLRV
jgi:hypothetical protein